MDSVSTNIVRPFLKQNGIEWSGVMQTSLATIVMLGEIKFGISLNDDVTFLMDATYKGKRCLFNYKISEDEFLLKSVKGLTKINLSKQWKAYLDKIKNDKNLDGEDLFV